MIALDAFGLAPLDEAPSAGPAGHPHKANEPEEPYETCSARRAEAALRPAADDIRAYPRRRGAGARGRQPPGDAIDAALRGAALRPDQGRGFQAGDRSRH